MSKPMIMTLPMKKSYLEVIESPEAPKNPVAELWNIELLYGKHPAYSHATYAASFTTRLAGGASCCFLVIELRDRFEEFLHDLNVFGVMERADFMKVVDYIKMLKIKGIFREVPDLLQAINGEGADSSESLELFELVAESILNEIESYPTVTSDEYKNSSPGIILDTDSYRNKYGAYVAGVTTETLYEILGLENNHQNAKRLQEIVRTWAKMGKLIKKSSQNRLQEAIRPNINSKEVKRFYLLKVDGLEVQMSDAV
ncbi:hypothetical protein AB4114_22230 [Paenibacillus sp. 2RAB27]|uniref:hypothetical protein n=1 Tax=Paenibacillus sp. 2RAB27 TaxID=3232991 RepID=UPI003F95640E